MAPLLSVKAPAKINPVLEVLGKRPDGYHELSLLFQTISLHDILTFEISPQGLQFECPEAPAGLTNDDANLVLKAAKLFLKDCPQRKGVHIHLAKNIPIAAGLGGGSSDAAATLLGLNSLFQSHLSEGKLQKFAEQLGSDVPFFLKGGTALGTGRGEKIISLSSGPEMNLVLVKPDQGLSTPAVYQSGKAQFTGGEKTRQYLNFLREKRLPYLAGSLFNGLESAAFFLMPEVETIKKELLKAGALGALVSGSGPTVFGVVGSQAEAKVLAEKMRGEGRQVFVTQTI